MKTALNVALGQFDLVWENPEQNRKQIGDKISQINEPVDLIILPEMFTSGFTMNPKNVAETMNGTTVSWMHQLSKKKNAAITGSLVIKENGVYYNRLIFVTPDGDIHNYNKRHTFTLAGEDKVFEAGQEKVVFNFEGWKICPMICYDLRFPVWSRNSEDYDVLIYVANWPSPRINAWDALLKARAIENMSYCIGVNRVGRDGSNHDYPGHSAAYGVLGNTIGGTSPNMEQMTIVSLDKNDVKKYRKKLGFLNDRDHFTLKE
jgi:omega-amidase